MYGSVYVCASVYRHGRNHHTLGGGRDASYCEFACHCFNSF